MDNPNSELRRSITTNLMRNVAEMPAGPNDRAEPVADMGRTLVEENERAAVAEHVHDFVTSRIVVLVLVAFMIMGYILLGVVLWVWGIITLMKYHKQPCDQPLTWWLLGMLSWVAIDKVFCSNKFNQLQSIEDNMRENARATSCSVFIRSVFLGVGFWQYSRSDTCAETNPQMYSCVHFYLIFNTILVVCKVIISCLVMRLMIWMARNGHGPFAQPGPHRAARAGLVDELATVEFKEDLFAEDGDSESGRPPRECCVCQEDFDSGDDIKSTPCGPVPHYFHRECLRTWLERYGKTCPFCRTDLQKAVDGVV